MKLINNPHFKASITLLIIIIIFSLLLMDPIIIGVVLTILFVVIFVGGIYKLLYDLFDEDL